MKVNIVCYEDVHVWILGKFALKMQENLLSLGIEASISKKEDPLADINHHIIYLNYKIGSPILTTLMITHIDDSEKLSLLKKQLAFVDLGICMSKESVNKLSSLGIPRNKLCYVNPAQDNIIKARKICIGITCGVQNDGRKREHFIGLLADELDPSIFCFKIMGFGWLRYFNKLKEKGFEVEYYQEFNYSKYVEIVPTFDYYLYTGLDEGQMGFIDALNAGIKTIVTPQGYHLDVENGISYPFNTYEDLSCVFKKISSEKSVLINSVKDWTWKNYTLKHLEIWDYLHSLRSRKTYQLPFKKEYTDGIFSLLDNPSDESLYNKRKELSKLRIELVKHKYYKVLSKIRPFVFRNR